jgi:hypothetical protein
MQQTSLAYPKADGTPRDFPSKSLRPLSPKRVDYNQNNYAAATLILQDDSGKYPPDSFPHLWARCFMARYGRAAAA